MQVVELKDGGFAFVFGKEEKALGLSILSGLKSDNPQVQEAIEQSKMIVILAGENKSNRVH